MEIVLVPAEWLRPFCAEAARRLQLNLAASAVIVIVFFLVFPPGLLTRVPHECLVLALLGVPCPGCGITTSLFHLTRLDARASLAANPAGIFLAVSLVIQACGGVAGFISDRLRQVSGRVMRLWGALTLTVLSAVWAIRLLQIANS